jgi:hypothetical protein
MDLFASSSACLCCLSKRLIRWIKKICLINIML